MGPRGRDLALPGGARSPRRRGLVPARRPRPRHPRRAHPPPPGRGDPEPGDRRSLRAPRRAVPDRAHVRRPGPHRRRDPRRGRPSLPGVLRPPALRTGGAGTPLRGCPGGPDVGRIHIRPRRPVARRGGGLPVEPLPQRGPDPRRFRRAAGPRPVRGPGRRGLAHRRGPRDQGARGQDHGRARRRGVRRDRRRPLPRPPRRLRPRRDGPRARRRDRVGRDRGLSVRVEQTVMRTGDDRTTARRALLGFARLLRER